MGSTREQHERRREAPPTRPNAGAGVALGLAAVLVLSAAARFALLDVPLERDEGEYAYAGQLILQGVPPYGQLYSMKWPGIHAAYAAVLAVFGESARGIHLGLLCVNLATTGVVFLLGRRLLGAGAGLAAAAFFAVLSLGPGVQGFVANAEHFVLLPGLAGLLLLVRALDEDRLGTLLGAGLLLGLAALVKQHGAALLGFAFAWLLLEAWRRGSRWGGLLGRGALLAAGPALLCATALLVLRSLGVLDRFWFWTFDYARLYVSEIPLARAPGLLVASALPVIAGAPAIHALAVAGLTTPAWDAPARRRAPFLLGLALFGFLAVLPGFWFWPHYFLFLMPPAALLAGSFVAALGRRSRQLWSGLGGRAVPVVAALIASGLATRELAPLLFELSPVEISRRLYPLDAFPETVQLAEHIGRLGGPDARVAVMGSEPQIYFHAQRRAATGYIYTYALTEPQPYALDMQREMIREIEAASPEFLIWVNLPTSWLPLPADDAPVVRWFERYRRGYVSEAVVDVRMGLAPTLRWAEETALGRPRSPHWIWLLRRRAAGDEASPGRPAS